MNVNETPSQRQQQHHTLLSLSGRAMNCSTAGLEFVFGLSGLPPLNHLITPSHTMEEHHPKSSARHLSLVTVGAQIYLKTWSDEKLGCSWVQGLFCWTYLRQREGSSKISNFLPNLKVPYMKILQNSQKIFTSKCSSKSPYASSRLAQMDPPGRGWMTTPILTDGLVVSLAYKNTS